MNDFTLEKTCTKCRKSYPANKEYFHVIKGKLRGACKVCINYQVKQIRGANPDYHMNWYKGKTSERKEYVRKWRADNEAILKEKKKQYKLDNKEKVLVARKREYRENKEAYYSRAKKAKRIRRAREYNASGNYTDKDVKKQLESQKGLCWWCLKPLNGKYHADHRIPISRGGNNSPENIVVACPKCNLSKNNKLPHEWIGRLL